MKQKQLISLFQNFSVALAILLIWRGLWYILDAIDAAFFGGDHTLTTVGGILIGILILYLPDHDLKELGRM